MQECEITIDEILDIGYIDEYTIPRILASKGFTYTGGPIAPKLKEVVGSTIDLESGAYKFKQVEEHHE